MSVSEKGEEVTKVPLDDIGAVIARAHGLTYSNNLLVQLAQRNVPFVVCGANFTPVAYLWSLDGNYKQSARMDAQISATLPKSKQLWKQIVQSKISQQAVVLEATGANPTPVRSLEKAVRSGDPDNIEAQAARRYWPLLFGKDFRRDRQAGGINGMLNYGYTVLRSCVARAIMGAGLHPSIGIHHLNSNNPMRLVDDLMEPFRPFVDWTVWNLVQKQQIEVSTEVKRKLASILDMQIAAEAEMTSLSNSVQDSATSLAFVYLGKADLLLFPQPALPLWLEAS